MLDFCAKTVKYFKSNKLILKHRTLSEMKSPSPTTFFQIETFSCISFLLTNKYTNYNPLKIYGFIHLCYFRWNVFVSNIFLVGHDTDSSNATLLANSRLRYLVQWFLIKFWFFFMNIFDYPGKKQAISKS